MSHRRDSYARVLAGGAGGSQSIPAPARSGAVSQLLSSSAALHAPTSRLSRSIDADAHHSPGMSTSWGRQGTMISYASQVGYFSGLGVATPDIPPFFEPSYLRGSRYAERLHDAHKAKVAAQQRAPRSSHSSNPPSLSTSSSSATLHKLATSSSSYRGLSHEVVERAPTPSGSAADEPTAPWPTRWNDADRFPQLELEESGRQAKFAGTQKTHDEAAAVRADYAMPRGCGVYYYEVTVVSKGKDGRMVGVGFAGPKVSLSRIPGWEPDSYAYHGDDGQIFSNTTSGKVYGPKFGTLDVIGCGINFRTNTAFFTKNGQFLGVAFRDLKPDKQYFPTVGMKKPGETLRANFGQDPFAFDIDKMVQDEKAAIQAEIAPSIGSAASAEETKLIHQLVGQYLAHEGYAETARVFAEEVFGETRALTSDEDAEVEYQGIEDDLDTLNRQNIRAAILDGDIDKALKHTSAYYPSVLNDNKNIYFKLRCRKFIEMIRRCNELHAECMRAPLPTSTQIPPLKRSGTASTRDTRTSTATDEYDFEMELDEQLGVHNPPPSWDNHKATSHSAHAASEADDDAVEDPASSDDDDADVDDLTAKHAAFTSQTSATIAYGMELRTEFANDPRREVKKALEDTFALIAYENVTQSRLAPLLEVKGRGPVAEELNGAILVSQGHSPLSSLECLIAQTEALVNTLGADGGPGAFLNVRRDYLM